jgi:hypothetical protein
MEAAIITKAEPFFSAQEKFVEIVSMLSSIEMLSKEHGEIEKYIKTGGFELLRRMMQAHLELRSEQEQRTEVIDSTGIRMTRARSTERSLETIFGTVSTGRLGYSKKGMTSLHPLDGQLNLPQELYSHGIRRLVAEQASKESFDEVIKSISAMTGAQVGKRQTEELAERAAADFDSFYASKSVNGQQQVSETAALLVLQTDAKGVVMRKADLREATRKAAETQTQKMSKRLSRGEKRNRKRMAQVASVYTVAPYFRTPEQIVNQLQPVHESETNRPKPEDKRVWASVQQSAQQVIAAAFEEAAKRDPEKKKTWLAVVDGNEPQLDALEAYALKYGVVLTIVLDLIHVIEYLWRASYVFNQRESHQAEQWVSERLLEILRGNSSAVAGGIRRSATLRALTQTQREPADDCADYLLKYRPYLHYDYYLAEGFPIASGVIEGACRYLVKDRMDLTGARWGLNGSEAVLKLRSLRASGDFDHYWLFHLNNELVRNHKFKYSDGLLPGLSLPSHLRLVK